MVRITGPGVDVRMEIEDELDEEIATLALQMVVRRTIGDSRQMSMDFDK